MKKYLINIICMPIYKKKLRKKAKKYLTKSIYTLDIIALFKIIYHKYIKKEHIIIIKHCAPHKGKSVENWGDTHLARDLIEGLERKNLYVVNYGLDKWNTIEGIFADTVVAIIGNSIYTPKKYNKNILWLISHPELIKEKNLKKYDKVCIASKKFAKEVSKKYGIKTSYLPQFTNPKEFFPVENSKYKNDILFVGNARDNEFREVVKFCVEEKLNISVYGHKWEKYIPKKYIKGHRIKNAELNKHYSNAKIVLSDHWEDMRENGFVANRIYDATACKALVISDHLEEIQSEYSGSVITYKSNTDFIKKINFYLENEKERVKLAEEAYEITINCFTNKSVAKDLLKIINQKGR